MTSHGAPASTRPRLTSASWWFRSADGDLVVAQAPNAAIAVWFAALIAGWLDLFPSRAETVDGVGHGALLVWALDELVRGASPFRRLLGVGVLVFQVVALVLG